MTTAAATPAPIKISWVFGLAGIFLIFVVVAVYSTRVARDTDDYDQDRAAARYATLAKLRADDEKTLTTADWIDQAKGIVRIPINEAIPETIVALQAKPVQMGAPIPGATPVNSTVPAAAANQAPAGSPQASPSTNAAPAQPPAPAPTAPNK